MKCLYLDNFRGFSNTVVPIADVNFLVGENSTGKTSVLGLVRLIASLQFWFRQSFDLNDLKFGHYNDIVSIHAKNRNYFRIGFIDNHLKHETPAAKNRKKPYLEGFLATYKEHNGLPRISRFTYIEGGSQHTLIFASSGVSYKSQAIPNSGSSTKAQKKIFDVWVTEHQSRRSGYRKLPYPEDFPDEMLMNLALAMAFLRERLAEDSARQDRLEVTFSVTQPEYLGRVVWIAPIRTQPRRTYDEIKLDYSPEGTHTPYVIRKILDSKKEATEFHTFMRRVGKSSGLFETVDIKRYGRGVTSPFEVSIVLDSKALNLSNVGYGVSQSLPVFVELLTRPNDTWFAIQQPEVHLHPRAQAALGDVFFDLASRERKHFFVETHSDYTIDRFRVNFRNRHRRLPHAQILFFERKNKRNTVWPITIGEEGELQGKQPPSYRRFFLGEQFRVLGI